MDKAPVTTNIDAMNRRTFVLLGSSALLWPAGRGHWPLPARVGAAGGRLRFSLDQQRRWSVWYQAAEDRVPLLQDAELGAWIGDRLITLADLEDITEGTRQPPGGDALVVRGRAAGVYLEAEFAWETGTAAAPRGAVTLRFYPDRELPTIRGVRFADLAEAATLPGPGPLLALVNAFPSGGGVRIQRVTAGMPATQSHAVSALARGNVSLGLSFDPGEAGDGRIRYEQGRLDAASEWRPARPLFPQGDAATLRICYDPAGDGLSALRALLTPPSLVDQEMLATTPAPVGWSSRSELGGRVTEDDVVANLELAARTFDRQQFRLIHVDDGFQRAAGDWDTNSRFPHGHRWLTDRIHAQGLQAGIWLAPFAVSEASGVPAAHPEWLLRRGRTPIVLATRDAWGGKVFALDGAHRGVQEWLFGLGRRVVRDWGYDAVHADLLEWACEGDAYAGGLTGAEAYRRGLGAFRDGLGADSFLLGSAAPLQHAGGLVSGMRVGADVTPTWGGLQAPARTAGLRSFYHRTRWVNHPGSLIARAPLELSEARVWTSLVALAGGATMLSDDLTKLPAERLAVLRRAIPPVASGGRPVNAIREDADVAPAIISGETVHPLTGTWRFRTGDDSTYAASGFDDSVWETIPVPGAWEQNGRSEYDGFAWYRLRFTLPAAASQPPANAVLDLGKLDDADETFVNGTALGQTGAFPPAFAGDRHAYRRYAIPAGNLIWGGENVLAIRVFDGGGPGGLWSTSRDRPADVWVVEGREDWWTLGVFNWDDAPRTIAVPLTAAGLRGERFHAYDAWGERALPDVTTTLDVPVPGRDVMIVSLRPATTARAQILGTSRHVVQGAIDILDEQWDATNRTLQVTSGRLDKRPYTVTVAVPRGSTPGPCTSDVACTTRRLPGGQLVIEWPATETPQDIKWSVRFRAAAARSSSTPR